MLPESWIDRIFLKMQGRYGSLFLDRWKGCDMANVKATWAEELGGFADKPECIGYALKALADQQFPPTLPEFLTACRQAPRGATPKQLEYKPSEEDIEKARQYAAKAAEETRSQSTDGLIWVKRPRSQIALDYAFEASKRVHAIKDILCGLIEKGICTESGALINEWDGREWRKAA